MEGLGHRGAYSLAVLPSFIRCIFILFSMLSPSLEFNLDVDKYFIVRGTAGTYFGHSIGLMINKTRPWIVVGAPLTKVSDTLPVQGAVFRCDAVPPGKCEQQLIGDPTNYATKGFTTHIDDEDVVQGLLFGASMDVIQTPRPKIIACAPLWINLFALPRKRLFPNGICYEKQADDPLLSYKPLRNYRNQYADTSQLPKYAYGEAGHSVHYIQTLSGDDTKPVAGAPNLNSRGGIIENLSTADSLRADTSDVIDCGPVFTQESYAGYALSSGVFFKDEVSVIIGAPNFKYKGKALVMRSTVGSKQISSCNGGVERTSDQVKSYFGAAVCAADFNGDGLDELIVGSPHYSKKVEEGKVFIYANSEQGLSLEPVELIGSAAMYAHFGSALANIGDINKDSYADLAVGAPFEGKGKGSSSGAIYVYNGSPSGIRVKYAQRIPASMFKAMRGFGWSLTRPLDMDKNGYSDFAVGSVLSDKVVLLRTRPVVNINASLEVIPKQIITTRKNCEWSNKTATCANVTLCLQFSGEDVPDQIIVAYRLIADSLKQQIKDLVRTPFLHNSKLITTIYENVTLRTKGQDTCFNTLVVITSENDLFTVVQFEANFSLIDTPFVRNGKDLLTPVLNIYDQTTLVAETGFQLGCGNDGICETDLIVRFTKIELLTGDVVIVGKDSIATVGIQVQNTMEHAYLAGLSIQIPKLVSYIGSSWAGGTVRCLKSASSGAQLRKVYCHLGNPMSENSTLSGTLRFNLADVTPTMREIRFAADVMSTSSEEASRRVDNNAVARIKVKLQADLDIVQNTSDPEQHTYTPSEEESESESREELNRFNVTNTVIIRNSGPSILPAAQLVILVPVKNLDDEEVSGLNDVTITLDAASGGATGECTIHPLSLEPEKIGSYLATLLSRETGSGRRRRKRSAENDDGSDSEKDDKKTKCYVNCKTYKCVPVVCTVQALVIGDRATVNVNFEIYGEPIFQKHKSASTFLFESRIVVQPVDHVSFAPLIHVQRLYSKVVTILYPKEPPVEAVPIWVIIVSAVCSFLLLLVIGIILWKVGFFKRKKHKTVQQWRRDSKRRSQALSSTSSGPPSSPPPTSTANVFKAGSSEC